MRSAALWIPVIGAAALLGTGLGIVGVSVQSRTQVTPTAAMVDATPTRASVPTVRAEVPQVSDRVIAPPSIVPAMVDPKLVLPERAPVELPPSPAPTVAQATVRGTGGSGLIIRSTPGGQRIASASEGEHVVDLGERREVDGRRWMRVRAADGVEGWAAVEFLTVASSPSEPAPAPITVAPTSTPIRPAEVPTSVPVIPPTVPPPMPLPNVLPTPTRAAPSNPAPVAPAPACCRRCTTGRACGNSCISASRNCNVGPGCACNASMQSESADLVSMTPEELEAEAVLLAELNAEPSPCEVLALVEGVE